MTLGQLLASFGRVSERTGHHVSDSSNTSHWQRGLRILGAQGFRACPDQLLCEIRETRPLRGPFRGRRGFDLAQVVGTGWALLLLIRRNTSSLMSCSNKQPTLIKNRSNLAHYSLCKRPNFGIFIKVTFLGVRKIWILFGKYFSDSPLQVYYIKSGPEGPETDPERGEPFGGQNRPQIL